LEGGLSVVGHNTVCSTTAKTEILVQSLYNKVIYNNLRYSPSIVGTILNNGSNNTITGN
jgi:hypothetical protein